MRTVNDVPVIQNEDWRNNPPKYDNFTDLRTVEWGIAEELTEIKNEFEALRTLTDEMNIRFVGGIQQGSIKSWDEVAEMLEEWRETVKQKLEVIANNFY